MSNEEINIMNNDNQKYYIGEALSRENLTKQYQYVLDLIIAYGGEGSKIDADMLDGHHASDFITKDDYYLDVLQSGMYIGSTQINNYKTINSQFLRDVDVKLSDMECSIFDVYKDDSISNDSVLTNINDVHYALELLGKHAEENEHNFGEFRNEYETFVNKEESRWANTLDPEEALELQRILNNHSVEALDVNNNLVHYYNKIPVIYNPDITDEEGEIVELYQDYNGTCLFVSNVPNIACELLDEETDETSEYCLFTLNSRYIDEDYLLDAQPVNDDGTPNEDYIEVYKKIEGEGETSYQRKYILGSRVSESQYNTNTFFSADMVNGLHFILITQEEYDNLDSELKDNWHYVYIIRDDINTFDDYADPTKIYTTSGLKFKFRVDPETQESDNPKLQFAVNDREWQEFTNLYYIKGENDMGLIPYDNLQATFEEKANKETTLESFNENSESIDKYPSNKVLTKSLNKLQIMIDDVNAKIKKLNGNKEVTKATSMTIETIINNVSSDEADIVNINSQISSINASLGEIKSAIDNLTSTTNSLSSSNSSLNTKVTNHINNKSNPHTVTKSQIGLGNVRNFAIYMGHFEKKVGAKDSKYYDVKSGIPKDRKGNVYISCNNNTIHRTARLNDNKAGSFRIFCINDTNSAVNIVGYWLWIG